MTSMSTPNTGIDEHGLLWVDVTARCGKKIRYYATGFSEDGGRPAPHVRQGDSEDPVLDLLRRRWPTVVRDGNTYRLPGGRNLLRPSEQVIGAWLFYPDGYQEDTLGLRVEGLKSEAALRLIAWSEDLVALRERFERWGIRPWFGYHDGTWLKVDLLGSSLKPFLTATTCPRINIERILNHFTALPGPFELARDALRSAYEQISHTAAEGAIYADGFCVLAFEPDGFRSYPRPGEGVNLTAKTWDHAAQQHLAILRLLAIVKDLEPAPRTPQIMDGKLSMLIPETESTAVWYVHNPDNTHVPDVRSAERLIAWMRRADLRDMRDADGGNG